MKFLFVIDSIDQPYGATPQLVRKLCSKLQELNNEITVLELVDDEKTKFDKLENITVKKILCNSEKEMHSIVQKNLDINKSKAYIIFRLLLKPSVAYKTFKHIVFRKGPRYNFTKNLIETYCKNNSYDVVVTASAPHHTINALANSNINAKKAAIMWDPYTGGAFYNRQIDYRIEENFLSNIDKIFVTDIIKSQYCNNEFKKYINKVEVLNFPSFEATVQTINKDNNSPVQCVFAGSVDKGVREPTHLMNTFKKLKDKNINLTLVGNGFDNFDIKDLSDNINYLGVVKPDEADLLIKKADILINIGNINNDQLPSKIFQYMATGKPIMHFYSNKNDTSLKYLDDYPCKYLVNNEEIKIYKIEKFCKNNKNSVVSEEYLIDKFYDYTPIAVAKKFNDIIKSI